MQPRGSGNGGRVTAGVLGTMTQRGDQRMGLSYVDLWACELTAALFSFGECLCYGETSDGRFARCP